MASQDPNTPLIAGQPGNVFVNVIFYAPLYIGFFILSLSFTFQNFKGILYTFALMIIVAIRTLCISNFMNNETPDNSGEPICNVIQYSEYENNTFSMFFIAFSFIYLCGPMILNGEINYWLMSALLFYYFINLFVRKYIAKCHISFSMILVDTFIFGIGGASLIIFLLSVTNNQHYLFFNENSSTKDICSMPSKQTFKCSVYKNGEIIGETNR
jgi:hypothetical protein